MKDDNTLTHYCIMITIFLIVLIALATIHDRREGAKIDKIYEIHKIMYDHTKCKSCHK